MTIRIVNSIKYIGVFTLMLFSVIACEKDFENIGVGLVDNNLFNTKDTIFEVVAYNQNVDSSRVDGIPQYLIGVYDDDNFGLINSSFIGQLALPTLRDFGENVSIDTIIFDIPYYATRLEDNTDGTPNFKLDSIIGDQEIEYTLSVHESGTFLNVLDPADITKVKRYYSNESYIKKAQLYSSLFKPNKNDTVLFVNRRHIDGDPSTIDDRDTIKKSNEAPSIKIPLDTVFFRNNFIDQQDNIAFDSFEAFSEYFRGLIIEADGVDGSLMTLAMNDATLSIYYTNDVLTDETTEDLNGDGDTDDIDVPVRTKQTKTYNFFGQRASTYTRNYSTSNVAINNRFDNPDVINGEDKLYLQGAAGSNAVISLFKGADLETIRNEGWLINEANLILYLDETSSENVPEQLFLYRFDQNSQLLDVFSEGQVNGIDGFLDRDEDDNKPIKYEFSITDYISNVLKSDEPFELEKLGLKVFHSTDTPDFLAASDTLVKDFSWIGKGVVLKGNNLPLTDTKRLKLEIFYTVNNE